jgi:hypothetical protein
MFIAKQNNKVFKAQNVWLKITGVFFCGYFVVFFRQKKRPTIYYFVGRFKNTLIM